jgi:hypothetical protein
MYFVFCHFFLFLSLALFRRHPSSIEIRGIAHGVPACLWLRSKHCPFSRQAVVAKRRKNAIRDKRLMARCRSRAACI